MDLGWKEAQGTIMCIYTMWSAEGSVVSPVCVGVPAGLFPLTATPLIKDAETLFYRDKNKHKEIKQGSKVVESEWESEQPGSRACIH